MCDSPKLKDSFLIQETLVDQGSKSQEKSNMDFSLIETSSPGRVFGNTEKEEDLSFKMCETPSPISDAKVNNNRSGSLSISNSIRSTRSKDNPEFIAKQKSFMAKVQAASSGNCEPSSPSERPETPGKRKRDSSSGIQSGKKKRLSKTENGSQVSLKEWQNDNCCWECHREGQFICCEMCPRVFHLKCAGLEKEPEEDWACSECHAVMQAENVENRSRAMQLISVDQLCTLLKYALSRLKSMPVMEPFSKPVDVNEFPTYWEIVVHPVDFTSLERNIKKKFYGSTEAFLSDARWIVHNSVIFNGANSKVTSLAKTLIKILKQELSEIETCPDCYENAHKKPDRWFSEACRLAHPLVWARLKGFPFWPAKAVKWKESNVDVRFFGRHDRSWVPLKECFLFSEQMPTPLKNRNKTLESCLSEVSEHIKKLRERFGKFKYAPHRLPFNPYDNDQIRVILPLYKGPAILRIKSQPFASKQSGHSGTDDETSSIASTDSGNSSYSRWRKRSLKDRSAVNTPDTETETDNISMDDESLQRELSKVDDTLETKNEEHREHEEKPEFRENIETPSIVDNEPPDKMEDFPFNDKENNEDEIKRERLEGEEDLERADNIPSKVVAESNSVIISSFKGLESDRDPETPKNDHQSDLISSDSLSKLIDSKLVESCPTSIKISQSVPDKAEEEAENFEEEKISEETLSKGHDSELEKEPSQLNKIQDKYDIKTSFKNNRSISMKVVKLTPIKVKDQKGNSFDLLSPNAPFKYLSGEKGNTVSLNLPDNLNNSKDKDNQDGTSCDLGLSETDKSQNLEESQNLLVDNVLGEINEDDKTSTEDCNETKQIKNEGKRSKKTESCLDNEGSDPDMREEQKETNDASNKQRSFSSEDLQAEPMSDNLVDENVRNFERINELLQSEDFLKEISNDVGKEISKTSYESTNKDYHSGKCTSEESLVTTSRELDKDELENKCNNFIESKKEEQNDYATTDDGKDTDKKLENKNKKSKIEEMMDDDYFQGFLDEINLRKKVETYQEIIKSARLSSPCEDVENEDASSENEEDRTKAELENRDFNEQLLTNTSLTIGKVSLPKSLKLQKVTNKSDQEEEEDLQTKYSLPSVNIRSFLSSGKSSDPDKSEFVEEREGQGEEEEEEEQEERDNEEREEQIMRDEESKMEANASLLDFQNYANKIFHNITISSKSVLGEKDSPPKKEKEIKSNFQSQNPVVEYKNKLTEAKESNERRKSKDEDENEEQKSKSLETSEENENKSDSLLEAVRLVKKIGNIAIKRVDSQTLEHTSGSDKVTISVANSTTGTSAKVEHETSKPSKINSPRNSMEKKGDNPLAGLGASVSVTKASDKEKEKEKEKEKVKMPSGVDTTRLSPSISIIPVSSSSSEKPKGKLSPSPGPSSTPQSSSTTTPTTTMTTVCSSSVSPNVSIGGNTTPSSSISASPNIPPPPLLSNSLQSPTGSNIRGMFGPPIGLSGGPRTPITSPGLRMMGNNPNMIMGTRFAGPPMVRHLPPEAGPLSGELHKHAHKLAEMMRTSLEEVLGGLVGLGTPEARLGALQLELERCNWRHQQELIEVRHNADVMLVEMRANLEAEKQRALEETRRQLEQKLTDMRRQMEMQMSEKLAEVRRQADIEKQRSIEETKKKQWCASCGKEALFFCCWNTSYCDYPCQQAHWPQHMSVCGQNSDSGGGSQSNQEGGTESMNGDASSHSSRGTTPVQGHHGNQVKSLIKDEPYNSVEEKKPRKARLDNPSEISPNIPGLIQTVKTSQKRAKVRLKKKRSRVNKSNLTAADSDISDEEILAPVKSPILEKFENSGISQTLLLNWFRNQPKTRGQICEKIEEHGSTIKTFCGVNEDGMKPQDSLLDESSKKKRKSTPCFRKRVDLMILPPNQVTEEMLEKVALKPREKTHDQGTGTSCHQCRQKTSDTKTICRSGKCVGLRGLFCGPCLKTTYGEDAKKAILDPTWSCPVCRGVCNCSVCRKAFCRRKGSGSKPKTPITDEDGHVNVTDEGEQADSEDS